MVSEGSKSRNVKKAQFFKGSSLEPSKANGFEGVQAGNAEKAMDFEGSSPEMLKEHWF